LKKTIYLLLIIFSFLGIPIFYYFVLDNAVSIKYETEKGDCISNVDGRNLCFLQDIYFLLTYLSGIVFILLLVFYKKIIHKVKFVSNEIDFLNKSFDELEFQFSKGLTIEKFEKGIRYFEFEQVKEWKSRFGYVFNIYSNDHFIDKKPHFHFDNKEKKISCKMSFEGDIFESNGINSIEKKVLKDLQYFLSKSENRKILIEKWNQKNPNLKVNN
jgi:hypothetical protein